MIKGRSNFGADQPVFCADLADLRMQRSSDGDWPVRDLKTRLKRAGSWNPQEKPISAAERFRVRNK